METAVSEPTLQGRHIDINEVCPICGFANEIDVHILYNCIFVKSCWLLSFMGWIPHSSLVTLLQRVVFSMPMVLRKEVLMVFWSLSLVTVAKHCFFNAYNFERGDAHGPLEHRKNVVWRQQFQSPSMVVNRARACLQVAKARRGSVQPMGWV